jgi:Tol biopolymer transport system component
VKGGPVVMKRNLETGEEKEVVKIKGINYDLSPDGKNIVFWGDGVTSIISVDGGAPRELYRGPVTYARWTGDGRSIVVKVGSDYWRIPAQGGTPVKLALTFDKVIFFTVHPDNRQIAFSVNEGVKRELWVMENFLPAPKAVK